MGTCNAQLPLSSIASSGISYVSMLPSIVLLIASKVPDVVMTSPNFPVFLLGLQFLFTESFSSSPDSFVVVVNL